MKSHKTCEYCGAPLVIVKQPDGSAETQCMDRCMESQEELYEG